MFSFHGVVALRTDRNRSIEVPVTLCSCTKLKLVNPACFSEKVVLGVILFRNMSKKYCCAVLFLQTQTIGSRVARSAAQTVVVASIYHFTSTPLFYLAFIENLVGFFLASLILTS